MYMLTRFCIFIKVTIKVFINIYGCHRYAGSRYEVLGLSSLKPLAAQFYGDFSEKRSNTNIISTITIMRTITTDACLLAV